MNIHEAAGLLRSGCFMRRAGWHEGKHAGLDGYGLFIKASPLESGLQMHFVISLDDLLAEDWEVYIPPYPTKSSRPTFRPVSGKPDRPSFPPRLSMKPEASNRVTVRPSKAPLQLKKK